MKKEKEKTKEALPNPNEVSKLQIEQWKQSYGQVFKYQTEDGKIAYFKKADLQIIDACRELSNGSKTEFNRQLAINLFIGGDREIIEKDDYLMGLFDWLAVMIVKVYGKLEQL